MLKTRVEDTNFYSKKSIRLGEKLLDLSSPKVMGIINCTPDSFYGNSRTETLKAVLQRVEEMVEAGVDLIDLGGYSTRPGAKNISINEEIERTIPALSAIRKNFPELPLSIDTFRGKVARIALENGADLINDINAWQTDEEMLEVVSHYRCPYILMHMRGTPKTMQQETGYQSLFKEICYFFSKKIKTLQEAGVHDIILDPGFGFAKTLDQNYELLECLQDFHFLNHPILVGFSRKSMIWKKLNTSADEALNGTTVLNTIALEKGASILRVHDVKEAKELVRLLD